MGSSAAQPRRAAPGAAVTHGGLGGVTAPRVSRPPPERRAAHARAVWGCGEGSRRAGAAAERLLGSAEVAAPAPRFGRRSFQAAAGGAAAYCLSPRPRCGAAPARPAGEPRAPHGESATELGGVGGSFAVRGGVAAGSAGRSGRGRGAAGVRPGARAGWDAWARGIAPRLPAPQPGPPITHCLPGAAARLAAPAAQPRGRLRSRVGGARPIPTGCDAPFPRGILAGPGPPGRLLRERGPQSPFAPGSCGCSAGPTGPGAGEQVPRTRGSGSRGLRRAVNTPDRAGLAGAPWAPAPGGAAGAPARVGDVQPGGTRLGTVAWAPLSSSSSAAKL